MTRSQIGLLLLVSHLVSKQLNLIDQETHDMLHDFMDRVQKEGEEQIALGEALKSFINPEQS